MTCKVYRLPRSWWAPPAQQTTVPPDQEPATGTAPADAGDARDRAIRAAAQALAADDTYGDLVPLEYAPELARIALAAAMPILRTQAAEEIAAAIEAYLAEHDDGGREGAGMETAARIARQHGEER